MVKTENLLFKYPKINQENDTGGQRPAISLLNLTIEKGEFVAVLGHNGSGKSTFAKHLNALLIPTEGKVFIKGHDSSVADNVWLIRKSAGMVFQNPDNQIIATVVEEDIAFGPENLGVLPSEIRQRVDSALKSVSMEEFRKRAPSLLSGGQKQRIAIAGVLAMRPEIIILDEATAMLDPIGRRDVMDIVKRLNREEGMTIIHITHHMEEAVLADRVVVMSAGCAVMDAAPKEVFRNVAYLKELGLDVPQVSELIHRLIDGGVSLPDDIISLDEAADALALRLGACGSQCAGISLESGAETDYRGSGHGRTAQICEFDFLPIEEGATTHLGFSEKSLVAPVGAPDEKGRNNQQRSCVEDAVSTHSKHVENIIELRDVSHVYSPGTVFEKAAIIDINFSVKKGEFFGIIGHTGSGKSTLIQHLNALMKPTSGQVLMNGVDINADKESLKEIRRKIGLVFQYPENQLFEMTVRSDVAFGPKNMGFDEAEIDRRVRRALSLVGINEEHFDKSPFELSGGQKRRVAIAGVIAMEPEILVMDEPTAGLDPKGRDEIFEQIKLLHKEMGNTVIIVSHSMEDIARMCERIAVLADGKLKYLGAPGEVFRNIRELEAIGLTAPQISYLVRELNEKGANLSSDIYTVDAAYKSLFNILLPENS